MKKIKTFLTGVFLLVTSVNCFAGYAEKDGGARHQIRKQVIVPILAAHGICRDDSDCDLKNVIKASSRVGVEFFIYGITDRKIINELLIAITQASNQYPSNLQLSVDAHIITLKEVCGNAQSLNCSLREKNNAYYRNSRRCREHYIFLSERAG